MKKLFFAAVLGAILGATGAGSAHADEALRRVQQSLRDQGFYYGSVDGSPGDETNQAVRRYQIRNGLAVTGQLDEETRRSILKTGDEVPETSGGGGSTRPTVRPAAPPEAGGTEPPRRAAAGGASVPNSGYKRPTVRTVPEEPPSTPRSVEDDEEAGPPSPLRSMDREARASEAAENGGRPDLRVPPGDPSAPGAPPPRNAVLPSARLSALFASTPYEFAPPPVQADVLRRVQGALTRQGFYDGPLNGVPSPLVTEALTNYQGVNRLRKTGRLDVSTLGNLRLLPGRQRLESRERGGESDGEDGGRRRPGIIFEGRVAH